MRSLILTASLVLAVGIPAANASTHKPVRHGQPCAKLFTVRMGERAGRAVYAGTRRVTRTKIAMLHRIETCQRNPRATRFVRWFDHHQRTLWQQRRHPPLNYAVASWYYDSGNTASGFHAVYGVAVCGSGGGPCVPFGTKILFTYHGRSVTAIADDHGPYIAGRAFDLNQNTAQALGFSGVDTVGYRIEGEGTRLAPRTA